MLKVTIILLFTLVTGVGFSLDGTSAAQHAGSDKLKNNTCVECHSRVLTASELSTRFLEWDASAHAAADVGCEKCHGGDPAAKDVKGAHRGIFAPSDTRSLLNDSTVSTTCGACHQAIARSFVETAHYQKLRTSGMGPSCTSCHSHMASSVRRNPLAGEALCTYCHNALDGVLPRRPDIPASSKATLDAIQRTQYVLTEINDLFAQADKRSIAVATEKKDVSAVKDTLEGAKVAWHTFNIKGVRDMADKAFDQAVEIRERLNKKLSRS